MLQAGLLIWLTLERTAIPFIKDGERQLFSLLDQARSFFDIPLNPSRLNPYVFINVSRDKRLRREEDGGRTVETDYDRLADLLTILARPQQSDSDAVRFVLCDLFIDESTNLSPALLTAIDTLAAAHKILFASRQVGLRSDGSTPVSNRIPRALSVYDDLNQYLIYYPLVMGDSSGATRNTAPLALYRGTEADRTDLAISPVKLSSWPWFRLGDSYHFSNPIVNHYLTNDDVGGVNKTITFIKHELYQLLKHKQLADSLREYGLAGKVVVIADLDPKSLEDKHLTTADEATFGVLTILNTWEMIRRGETRIYAGWLLLMFVLLTLASIFTIQANLAYPSYPEEPKPVWQAIRGLAGKHPRRKDTGKKKTARSSGAFGRRIGRFTHAVDRHIIHRFTGSYLKIHVRRFLQSFGELITIGGVLFVGSYLLFGIKIEFVQLTFCLATEGWLLRQIRDHYFPGVPAGGPPVIRTKQTHTLTKDNG